MGGACCGERAKYLVLEDGERNIQAEKQLLVKMMQFNWNHGHSDFITVQEMIMQENTNDLGEYLTPQTAHVIFTEFIKFMFLNAINIQMLSAKSKQMQHIKLMKSVQVENYNIKFCQGLKAPPYIDMVWSSVIKLRSYSRFCKELLGIYVERPSSDETAEDSLYSYRQTLNYLECHKDVVFPFMNLWPKYSSENCEMDINNFVSVTYKDLKSIQEDIENGYEEFKDINKESILGICETIKQKYTKLHDNKVTKQQEQSIFSSTIVKLKNGKTTPAKNLFTDIKERNTVYVPLYQRLMQKYLLKKVIAEKWIEEYYYFLVLLRISPENTVPSTVVELVWATHMEFYEGYARLSIMLFDCVLMHPKDYSMQYKSTSEWREKYIATLKRYETVIGCSPDVSYWEPAEIKCQSRCDVLKMLQDKGDIDEQTIANYRINVNIYRMVLIKNVYRDDPSCFDSKHLKAPENQQFVDPPKEIKSILSNIKKGRQEFAESNGFYGWRVNFCHCTNIYNDFDVESPESEVILYNPYEDLSCVLTNIFINGGFIIISDPFDEGVTNSHFLASNLYDGFYECLKVITPLELIQDDIADAALYKTGVTFSIFESGEESLRTRDYTPKGRRSISSKDMLSVS